MQPLGLSEALWLFVPIFLLSCLAIVPAAMAQRKGYSFWLAYISGVLIWLVTIVVVVLLPDKNAIQETQGKSGFKSCPMCGEDNEIGRGSCARCGARMVM